MSARFLAGGTREEEGMGGHDRVAKWDEEEEEEETAGHTSTGWNGLLAAIHNSPVEEADENPSENDISLQFRCCLRRRHRPFAQAAASLWVLVLVRHLHSIAELWLEAMMKIGKTAKI